MAPPAFQLNEQFIQQLWDRISVPQESTSTSAMFQSVFLQGNIPTREQLAQIIDVAYWASFATEEGNSVTASLILKPVKITPDTFRFDIPLELTAKTLVKLGPALENPKSDIGIWPDDIGTLKIWGFTSTPYELIKPDFWVQVLGPGRILIVYSGRSIAAVTGNVAVFLDHKIVMQSMMSKIADQAVPGDIQIINLLRYNAILKIAQQMRAHGRGGTILIVPENQNWAQSIKAPIRYTGGANFLNIESRQLSFQKDEHDSFDQITKMIDEMNLPHQQDWMDSWQKIQQQCNRIARLTAVDGALVMNFDRYVYCFGAKIRALNINATSTGMLMLNPFESESAIEGKFTALRGTRHQSAAQFAYDQPGSIAIAASIDGNVTFYTRDSQKDSLIALQQAELMLLHEGLGGPLWNLSLFAEQGWFEKKDERKGVNYLSAVIQWMKTTLNRE